MGLLKKPTVEAFVDKLIEENYISVMEAEKVAGTLETAIEGLSKSEKAFFIKTLSDKVDASSNEILAQNGLNYAGFEKIVQEVSKAIEKEKKDRIEKEEQEQKKQNETIKEELSEKEKMEAEKKEKIKENEDFIENSFIKFLELDDEDITKEEKEEMAENMYKLEQFDSLVEKYETEGKSPEEAEELAMKDLGMTSEDIEKPEMELAQAQIMIKKLSKLVEKGSSIEDAVKTVFEDKSASSRAMKKKIESNGLQESVEGIKILALGALKTIKIKRINNQEDKVASQKSDESLSVDRLKTIIEGRERRIASLRRTERKLENLRYVQNDESETELNKLYKKMANEYLVTGVTISAIYEKYKKKSAIEGLEFVDILDGVAEELSKDVAEVWGKDSVDKLKKYEYECRIVELTLKEYGDARKKGNEIKDTSHRNENIKSISKLKENIEKGNKDFADLKKHLISQRKLNPNKKIWDPTELLEEPEEIEIESGKPESLEQILKNRDNVNRDRNAIIRLAKEQNILSNEAAKQYFTENPEALKSYTKEERNVLLGEQETQAKVLKKNRFVQYLNDLVVDRNCKAMEKIGLELQELQEWMDEAENKSESMTILRDKKKRMQFLEARYKKIEKSNERLTSFNGRKTAVDVLEDKKNELNKKEIFKSYLNSKKSAFEIHQDLVNDGNEISFEEVLKVIKVEAKKYLLLKDVDELMRVEKTTYEEMSMMKIHIKEMGIAQVGGNIKEVESRSNKINDIRTKLEDCDVIRNSYKSNLLKVIDGDRESSSSQVESIPRRDEINTSVEVNEKSRDVIYTEQAEAPKLEVAKIETNSGMIPNVVAIAQKGNVTRGSVKNVFSRIFSLRKRKEEQVKGEDENNGNKKDTSREQDDTIEQ